MGTVLAGGVAILLATCLACQPVASNWDVRITTERCINRGAVAYGMAAFFILTDIAILILPMPVLKHLHLPRRQRISLMATFALGGL